MTKEDTLLVPPETQEEILARQYQATEAETVNCCFELWPGSAEGIAL
jgi:hypothetical protein